MQMCPSFKTEIQGLFTLNPDGLAGCDSGFDIWKDSISNKSKRLD